ncbi:MAG: MBL fold metallo-hydrolase [Symploca sp. SIO2D2]|nr:MBL fold metallo-hydrolase [Symploca sp. SIO2D2]
MQFSILGSSSSGNCTLLVTENAKVLIDAGFSCKRICEMLEERHVKPEEIDAIFVTHEHSDHTAGISTFTKKFSPTVYANMMTARAVQPKLKHKPQWSIFNTGSGFEFKDLTVESFSIPHDAHDPVGFTFTSGRGDDLFSQLKKLAWLTDLGFAPKPVIERIKDADTFIVESNYDEQLLEEDERRPWSLKQRISGRHGHLSNTAALELLETVERPKWDKVFLAHLSSDCNSEQAVESTFSNLKSRSAFRIETIKAGCGCELQAV